MGKIIHNGVTITREINTRNIITASLSSNHTLSSDGVYELLELASDVVVGSNLSVANDTVVCGKSGTVLISGKMAFNSCSAGLKWFTIYRNNGSILAFPINTSTNRISISIPPTLFTVSAGDDIDMRVNGATGDVVRAGRSYTELTVEYVD